MPTLNIATNLRKEDIPEGFLSDATKFIATQLGKPESYVLIQVSPDQLMSFGGSTEPAANVTLLSLGVVGPEKNRKMAAALSKFISQNLGIKKDRFYINIYDVPPSSCVWNGTTFG